MADKERGAAVKTYKAVIWKAGSGEPGRRVSVTAESLDDARARLEAIYGSNTVCDLHNEEDAARPR